jgi:hypothetical protein
MAWLTDWFIFEDGKKVGFWLSSGDLRFGFGFLVFVVVSLNKTREKNRKAKPKPY